MQPEDCWLHHRNYSPLVTSKLVTIHGLAFRTWQYTPNVQPAGPSSRVADLTTKREWADLFASRKTGDSPGPRAHLG